MVDEILNEMKVKLNLIVNRKAAPFSPIFAFFLTVCVNEFQKCRLFELL